MSLSDPEPLEEGAGYSETQHKTKQTARDTYSSNLTAKIQTIRNLRITSLVMDNVATPSRFSLWNRDLDTLQPQTSWIVTS